MKQKEESAEVNWQERAEQLEQLVQQMQSQIEEANWTIEVANERWVEQVNKNTALEVQLRRANKKG